MTAVAMALGSVLLAPQAQSQDDSDNTPASPLSFRLGAVDFTPGGFMDFTSVFRSTNTGNGIGTNFYSIPYNNTVQYHQSEFRMSAQNSRISLKAAGQYGPNKFTAYYEQDFLGNDAANTNVTSNSHTERLRLYWLDDKVGNWEFLAGQSWSFLTPNRVGLSPNPSDLFYTLNMDTNYQVGLTWTRAAQFRVIYNPNENWAFGVAVENPDQFGGQGEVTFPSAYNPQLAVQIDEANTAGGPALMPDIIPKVAYDTNLGDKHMHVEAVGLITAVKTTALTGTNFGSKTTIGAGGSLNMNLELVKGLHFIANTFYSDGGGRYIFGMAPQAVVKPLVGGGVEPVMVHSAAALGGFEWTMNPSTTLALYYGGMYAGRTTYLDITSAVPNSYIGFGGPSSANNNNRSIQEGTLDWIQTFWANPNYGKLQLITQFSYLTRSPWFVAAGAPSDAHLVMAYVDLRYVIP